MNCPYTDEEVGEMEVKISDFFTGNNSLRNLSLSNCAVDDHLVKVIARGLQHARCLEGLDVSRNKLTDECMPALCRGVIGAAHLKRLDLSRNHLSDRGAKIMAATLKNPQCSLVEIDITNNLIHLKGLTELEGALASNRNVLELKAAMNVGIPHHQVLKLKRSVDRNKSAAQRLAWPSMLSQKAFLKRNLESWRNECSNVNNKIAEELHH